MQFVRLCQINQHVIVLLQLSIECHTVDAEEKHRSIFLPNEWINPKTSIEEKRRDETKRIPFQSKKLKPYPFLFVCRRCCSSNTIQPCDKPRDKPQRPWNGTNLKPSQKFILGSLRCTTCTSVYTKISKTQEEKASVGDMAYISDLFEISLLFSLSQLKDRNAQTRVLGATCECYQPGLTMSSRWTRWEVISVWERYGSSCWAVQLGSGQ